MTAGSNTTVHAAIVVSLMQFVGMASSLRCIIKLQEVLHTHVRLIEYDAITHVLL